MKQQKVWRDLIALPPEAQKQAVDFIAFLRKRYAPSRANKTKRTKLEDEAFIGMWRNREDLQDSTAWVRETRRREWMSRRA